MLDRRSALAVHPRAEPGTELGTSSGAPARAIIWERRPLSILQISAFRAAIGEAAARLSTALGVPVPAPNRFSGEPARNLRALGAGVWQAVADEGALPAADALRDVLRGSGTVVDLSHARMALRIEGPAAARCLAKHCGIDLDPRAFPAGSATNTRFGHLGSTLACVGQGADGLPAFELLVFRGYAEFVFETLAGGAAEFGVRIGPVGT